jgi:hypothetical protein
MIAAMNDEDERQLREIEDRFQRAGWVLDVNNGRDEGTWTARYWPEADPSAPQGGGPRGVARVAGTSALAAAKAAWSAFQRAHGPG